MEPNFIERLGCDSADRVMFRFIDSRGDEYCRITTQELDRKSREIAGALMALRTRPTIISLPQGPELVVTLVGALRAGAVPVLCEPGSRGAQSKGRLEAIMGDCRPGLVITTADRVAALCDRGVVACTPDMLTQLADQGLDLARSDAPGLPDDTAYLQYTSGSTGRPAGTVVTMAALTDNLGAVKTRFQHGPASVSVIWLPPYHDMGLVGGILQALYAGFACVLIRTEDFVRRPSIWLKALSDYGGTSSGGPPFGWRLALDRVSDEFAAGLDLSRWDVAFVGAEPISEDVLGRFASRFACAGFRSRSFMACYGLAEATLYVSGTEKGEGLITSPRAPGSSIRDVSCGRVWPSFSLSIRDPQTGVPLAGDAIGEVCLRGPSLAPYLADDQGPSEGAADPPELRSGDLGYLREGHLFITGRLKAMIKVHGRKLLGEDIERAVLTALPQCHAAAAFGAAGPEGERLIVVVESRGRDLGPDAEQTVRTAVILETGVAPDEIVIVARGAIPRTVSGKIDRANLPAALALAAGPIGAAP